MINKPFKCKQVIDRDTQLLGLPLLAYVARDKSSSQPHHFKAGALNALVPASIRLSISLYIHCFVHMFFIDLNLDICPMTIMSHFRKIQSFYSYNQMMTILIIRYQSSNSLLIYIFVSDHSIRNNQQLVIYISLGL